LDERSAATSSGSAGVAERADVMVECERAAVKASGWRRHPLRSDRPQDPPTLETEYIAANAAIRANALMLEKGQQQPSQRQAPQGQFRSDRDSTMVQPRFSLQTHRGIRSRLDVPLLASPELVARTITAVRREGEEEDATLEESEVIEALGALEPVWDELYPAEQARILRLLVERIDVAPDAISVTLHAAGIRSLVAELADQETPALAASEPLLEAAE
jgi:hypothetical protein